MRFKELFDWAKSRTCVADPYRGSARLNVQLIHKKCNLLNKHAAFTSGRVDVWCMLLDVSKTTFYGRECQFIDFVLHFLSFLFCYYVFLNIIDSTDVYICIKCICISLKMFVTANNPFPYFI